MDKKKLKSLVKYNKFFLWAYRLLGNALIFFLKIFIKPNKKKILFMSFGGQKFDDSPKALYESMLNDSFFKEYFFVWAFVVPNMFEIERGKKIKIDTINFYKEAISCGVWINNSSVGRGLKLKTKHTFEVNTWHGTPLKKMGADIENNRSFSIKNKNKGNTIYCSQSEFDKNIFTRLFSTSSQNIIISDLPRNDYLRHFEKQEIERIKNKMNIPLEKKVILYAPTFREYERDDLNSCFIKPPVHINKWEEQLGNNFVLLFRAHYEVVKTFGIKNDSFCRNVSDYNCLNELMIISDILISDYSSIFFDYSILERPLVCFAYDLEQYRANRGLYEEAFSKLPCNILKNEDDVIADILMMNISERIEKTKKFKEKFAPFAGKSCCIVLEEIRTKLS